MTNQKRESVNPAVPSSSPSTRSLSDADRLRADLKASGYTARQVTVRSSYSKLHVTVRDAAVSLSEVATLANRYMRVHHDHATGEILSGGNTFVGAAYLESLYAARATEIERTIEAAPKGVMVNLLGGFRAARVDGAYAHLDEVVIAGPRLGHHDPEHLVSVYGIGYAAKQLAIAYLDAAARGELLEPDAQGEHAADATPDRASPKR